MTRIRCWVLVMGCAVVSGGCSFEKPVEKSEAPIADARVASVPAGMAEVTIYSVTGEGAKPTRSLEAMSKGVAALKGVTSATVTPVDRPGLKKGVVACVVTYDPKATSPEALVNAMEQKGYQAMIRREMPGAAKTKEPWTCSMCQVVSDKPGKCPECGMAMVKAGPPQGGHGKSAGHP